MGLAATVYLYLHQHVNQLFRPLNKDHPLLLATAVGLFTAIMIYFSCSYTEDSVGIISLVADVVNGGSANELAKFQLSPVVGLLISLGVRTLLVMIGNNIAVPAGILMPALLLGGIFGRIIGRLLQQGVPSTDVSKYALVGAVGFASGITQSVSVAVIGVELTGNINLILPLLLVSVLGARVANLFGLSIYDRGMLNKGLENFQLLLGASPGRFKTASEVMQKTDNTLCEYCTVCDLVRALKTQGQLSFPILDEEHKLVGSVKRTDLYSYVKTLFIEIAKVDVLRIGLPVDATVDDQLEAALTLRRSREQLRTHVISIGRRLIGLPSRHEMTADTTPGIPPKSSYHRIEKLIRKLRSSEIETRNLWSLVAQAEEMSSGASEVQEVNLSMDQSVIDLLMSEVNVLGDHRLPVHAFPYSVALSTPMENVVALFEMVKVHTMYVFDDANGQFRGTITSDRLLESLREAAIEAPSSRMNPSRSNSAKKITVLQPSTVESV